MAKIFLVGLLKLVAAVGAVISFCAWIAEGNLGFAVLAFILAGAWAFFWFIDDAGHYQRSARDNVHIHRDKLD